ncbi:MAG: choice-of-anchor D domain-containing protein, partial [Verrucomicrobiota bacterium]
VAIAGVDNVLESEWHLVSWTRDGNDFDHWVDGIEDTSDPFTYTESAVTLNTTTFGALNRVAVGQFFNGDIDEFRISCVERSSNWIWATYLNIASSTVFSCFAVTPGGAEINVLGTNGAVIANDDTTPVVSDGTDFGSVSVTNASLAHTFTITNVGVTNLYLTNLPNAVTISGHADFSISVQPAGTNVAASNSVTFTVLFDPDALGLRTATVSILSTDTKGNSPFTFLVQGTGVTPEMDVLGTNAASIADGDVTPIRADGTHFGYADTSGGSQLHTFTIQNSGAFELFLTGTPVVAISGDPDFTVTAQPSPTNVTSGGGTRTFTIQFMPTQIGTRTATVRIQNTDIDENPYTFSIEGIGITPEISVLGTNLAVIADGDLVPAVADGTDFGTNSAANDIIFHTFTVTNIGGSALALGGVPRVQISGDPEFTISAQPPVGTVASNASTT